MYPMDMEEFMLAMGENDLVEQIKICFATNTPLPSALHDIAIRLYRQYLIVGGMPECVMQFIDTNDYILIRHTQDTILASYLNDMSTYNNLNEIKKTRLAYDNITVQLSKKNTRFRYKLIKKGGRASEFENAIENFLQRILALKIRKRLFRFMLLFVFNLINKSFPFLSGTLDCLYCYIVQVFMNTLYQ